MTDQSLHARPDQLPDRLPKGFDIENCLTQSRENFACLHAAWENADINSVRTFLAPSILTEVETALSQGITLRDWGQKSQEIQHLGARILSAKNHSTSPAEMLVQIEFFGHQLHLQSNKLQNIHEIWEVLYHQGQNLWQIQSLQSSGYTA